MLFSSDDLFMVRLSLRLRGIANKFFYRAFQRIDSHPPQRQVEQFQYIAIGLLPVEKYADKPLRLVTQTVLYTPRKPGIVAYDVQVHRSQRIMGQHTKEKI